MPHSIVSLVFYPIVTFTLLLLPHSVLNLAPGVPYTPQEMKAAREAALKWHNILRKWHNTTSMTLDDKLNEAAQTAANNLVPLGKMKHNSSGENLYTASHSGNKRFDATAQTEGATKAWYFEICDTKTWPTGQLNHFTQVVWADSVKLGIGVATDKDNSAIFVVGRYEPFGNYVGEYDIGVKKLVCKKTAICNGLHPKVISGESDNCLENKKGSADEMEDEVEEKAGKKSCAPWGWGKSYQFFVFACCLGVINLHIIVTYD